MKKSILTVALMVVTCIAFAQKDLIESKSLVGIWQMQGMRNTEDGKTQLVRLGNYKVLNKDGTFYAFAITNNDLTTNVSICGSFKITSDSTYTESVIAHYTSPEMNNSESKMRYKFIDKDTLVLEYYNNAIKRWIPEVWVRVTPRK